MLFQDKFKFCPTCGSSSFEFHNEKSKHCMHCNFVYYFNASAAVAAFIVNHKNELLVCTRGKNPAKGTLDLPGGFVDYQETAEEAIVREIREELGVDVLETSYLFSLPNKYLYSDLEIPTLDLFFCCKINDKPLCAADDVAACSYIPLPAINAHEFGLESIKKAVKWFLSNNTFTQQHNI